MHTLRWLPILLFPYSLIGQSNVGIGTSTPLAKLDIENIGDGAELLRLTTDRPWVFKQTGSGIHTALTLQSMINDKAFTILSSDGLNHAAIFHSNDAFSRVSLVPENGHVGIGQLLPEAKLHIHANSSANYPQLRLTEVDGDYARIKMENELNPDTYWDIAGQSGTTESNSRLNFFFSSPGSSGDRMTIVGNGNVGIGTINPGNRLRVNGDPNSTNHILSAGTNYSGNVNIRALEGFSVPAAGYGLGGYMVGGRAGVEGWGNGGAYIGTSYGLYGSATGTAGTRIGVYGTASGGANNWAGYFGPGDVFIQNDLRVDGDVGIGTATPLASLDVNGAVKIGYGSANPQPGMIRWNTTTSDFEGYNGTEWVSLTLRSLTGGWGVLHLNVFEHHKSKPSDGASQDLFGTSVSISGQYSATGAPGHDTNGHANRGKAYVHFNNGSSWNSQASLISSDGTAGDEFGTSVSIAGTYVLAGAPFHPTFGQADRGKGYLFFRSGTSWSQQQILYASDGQSGDEFGTAVGLTTEFAIIGAPEANHGGNTAQGKAYIFERIGANWSQLSILTASDGAAHDDFGIAVAISGVYAIVGAPHKDFGGQLNLGKAYIYAWTGPGWTQQQILTAPDGVAHTFFGNSVSISGDYAAVGCAWYPVEGESVRGQVYIYKRTGTTWAHEFTVKASDGKQFDDFGRSVSLSGDWLAVGADAYTASGGVADQGIMYLFKRNGTTWTEVSGMAASDAEVADYFGTSVATNGTFCIAGSPFHDNNNLSNMGSIYFFARN